jgi:hypothetical protein
MSPKPLRFWSQVILLIFLISPIYPARGMLIAEEEVRSPCEMVVLADPIDPYYSLAQEIATVEKAPLAHTLAQATTCQPTYLLWVVSPGFLSDAVMIAFGTAMKAQTSAISTGIITASTLEGARSLWMRRDQARGNKLLAANAPNPSAHIDQGQLFTVTQQESSLQLLTKTTFVSVLRSVDYLTFTGHGSSRYLRLDEATSITAADIPPLGPLVINTGSCQTVRPWIAGSIALQFIDQGAAAYSGFVYSPNEGYLLGEFDGFPMRYTWADFPIGHVIQAQNRGALQGFAQFPYLFLLGDPRIALQSGPVYRPPEEYREGDQRVLTFHDLPSGVIPIRIDGGAAYHFVAAPGLTAATDQDLFYNSRLQMVNIGPDKFILLVQNGGDLTLRLSPQAPWTWFLSDFFLDSLDHTLIFSQQSGGDLLALAFSILPLAWAAWQGIRRRLSWQNLRLALALGFGVAVVQGLYTLTRLGHVTITTKVVVFSPLSLLATFILTTCGALIYFRARSWIGKAIALLVATFASWAAGLTMLLVIGALNRFGFMPQVGVALYNYFLSLLTLGAFLIAVVLLGVTFGYANRWASQ